MMNRPVVVGVLANVWAEPKFRASPPGGHSAAATFGRTDAHANRWSETPATEARTDRLKATLEPRPPRRGMADGQITRRGRRIPNMYAAGTPHPHDMQAADAAAVLRVRSGAWTVVAPVDANDPGRQSLDRGVRASVNRRRVSCWMAREPFVVVRCRRLTGVGGLKSALYRVRLQAGAGHRRAVCAPSLPPSRCGDTRSSAGY